MSVVIIFTAMELKLKKKKPVLLEIVHDEGVESQIFLNVHL